MGKFVKGDVVIAPFPYSDLTKVQTSVAENVIEVSTSLNFLYKVIRHYKKDDYSISLQNADFQSGTLHQNRFIRPNRLFTADASIILYKAGDVKKSKMDEVVDKIIAIIKT